MASAAPKTAYITGGASGIGLALTTHLLSRNWRVFVADLDTSPLHDLQAQHNTDTQRLWTAECDTTSWESQERAFTAAVKTFGRVGFVAPVAGIGERAWVPFGVAAEGEAFVKPDLSVMDVNLTGVLYTVALAVQHFRRVERVGGEVVGRVGVVASICGLYCIPSVPIYTAGKHALVGLTRSYGRLLVGEGIMVNAVAPNVVRTSIRSAEYYDQLETQAKLTPIEGVMAAFEDILESRESGNVYECGPKGGWTKREDTEYLDKETEVLCKLLDGPRRGLHYTPTQ